MTTPTADAWTNAVLGVVLLVAAYMGLIERHPPTYTPGPAQVVALAGVTPDPAFGTGTGAYLVTTVRITTSTLADLLPVYVPDVVARYTRGPGDDAVQAGTVDALTPGDLTGGKVIAGTGVTDYGGQVGEVGRADLKIIGAQDQHPAVFFAPAANEHEALSAGTPTPVVGVGTLSEAVAWLCAHGGESTACPGPARH